MILFSKKLKGSITPEKSEKFYAYFMEAMGYRASVTRYSEDGGAGVIVQRDELGLESLIIKIQCWQVNSTIGRVDIQKLDGAAQLGEFGLFITLGTYTSDVRTYEQMKSSLCWIDGPELVDQPL